MALSAALEAEGVVHAEADLRQEARLPPRPRGQFHRAPARACLRVGRGEAERRERPDAQAPQYRLVARVEPLPGLPGVARDDHGARRLVAVLADLSERSAEEVLIGDEVGQVVVLERAVHE